jgi:ubiquinone biosynthesis protein
VLALLGAALMIGGVLLYAFHIGGRDYAGAPLAVWIAGVGAIAAFIAAWPRRR